MTSGLCIPFLSLKFFRTYSRYRKKGSGENDVYAPIELPEGVDQPGFYVRPYDNYYIGLKRRHTGYWLSYIESYSENYRVYTVTYGAFIQTDSCDDNSEV